MPRTIDTGTDTVRIEVLDRIGVITFTRPERRNALHDEMYAPIIAALESFANDPSVGCVVVTGEGSAFCSGGDVRAGSGRRADGSYPEPSQRAANLEANAQVSLLFREAPIITIAAVNGAAVGAGMAIALACDLRIAASSARFIGGWARLGFSGDFGGAWLLTQRVGPARALELLASNATVSAPQALAIGLVERVIGEDDDFESAWRAWAMTFANGPRLAIANMKANIADAHRLPLAEALHIEALRMMDTTQTADHREAVRAWVERREPIFGKGESC